MPKIKEVNIFEIAFPGSAGGFGYHRDRRSVFINQITTIPEVLHAGDDAFVYVSFKNAGRIATKKITLKLAKDPIPPGVPPTFSRNSGFYVVRGLQ